MRVDLGCGPRKPEGYFGIDRHSWPGVDMVADLSAGIPLDDGSVSEIRAHDLLEHLPDKIRTMNELWRVLKPGGIADLVVPSTDGRGAWQDPTHVSYWNRNSFWYYEDGNPHLEVFGPAYGVTARFKILSLTETEDVNRIVHVHVILRAQK